MAREVIDMDVYRRTGRFTSPGEAASRALHPSNAGPGTMTVVPDYNPDHDPVVRCATCRGTWFRQEAGVSPDGFAHEPAIRVTVSGEVVAWSGALRCATCDAGPFFLHAGMPSGLSEVDDDGPAAG